MKKMLFAIACLLLSVTGYAQEGLKVGISFGPAFVGQTTEVGGVSSSDTKFSGLGYRLGLEMSGGFTDNIALYTGVALVQKGVKNGDARSQSNILEIPLGLKMRSNEISSGIRAGGLVAPTLDLRMSSKTKINDVSTKTTEFTKFMGFGVKIGAVADKEFDFGTGMLILAYNIGLSDHSKTDLSVVKTNYFQVGLGFIF